MERAISLARADSVPDRPEFRPFYEYYFISFLALDRVQHGGGGRGRRRRRRRSTTAIRKATIGDQGRITTGMPENRETSGGTASPRTTPIMPAGGRHHGRLDQELLR